MCETKCLPTVRRVAPPRSCTNPFTRWFSRCHGTTACIRRTITTAEPSPPWPRRKLLIPDCPSLWKTSSASWTTSTCPIPRWSVSVTRAAFRFWDLKPRHLGRSPLKRARQSRGINLTRGEGEMWLRYLRDSVTLKIVLSERLVAARAPSGFPFHFWGCALCHYQEDRAISLILR